MRRVYLSLAGVAVTATAFAATSELPFEHPHAESQLSSAAHLTWESRYASEGRDSLDGDSLASATIELGWNHLTGGIWYGSSPGQDYDELQLSLGLSQEIGAVAFYLAYTRIEFPFANAHDNEVGTGFSVVGLPLGLEFAADAYYSFDADGWFAELSLSRSLYQQGPWAVSATGVLGVNQGYVADGHDGANHAALRLDVTRALTEQLDFIVHFGSSWAINSDPIRHPGDAQLRDFLHAGFGLSGSF